MIEKFRSLAEQFRQKGNGVYKSETVMVTVKTANVCFELSQKEDVFIEQDGTIIIPHDIVCLCCMPLSISLNSQIYTI